MIITQLFEERIKKAIRDDVDNVFLEIEKFVSFEHTKELIKPYEIYKENIQKEIKTKYKKFISHLQLLICVHNELFEFLRIYSNQNNIEYRINAITKIIKRSIQIEIDVLSLFESGSFCSISILARNVYENYILSQFLNKQSEAVSLAFNQYAVIQKYKDCEDKIPDEDREEYLQIKNNLGDKYMKSYSWTLDKKFLTFNAIRTFVNETQYYSFYKKVSDSVHTSSTTVNSTIATNEIYTNINSVGYFTEYNETTIVTMLEIIKENILFICDIFFDKQFEYERLTYQNTVELITTAIIKCI